MSKFVEISKEPAHTYTGTYTYNEKCMQMWVKSSQVKNKKRFTLFNATFTFISARGFR